MILFHLASAAFAFAFSACTSPAAIDVTIDEKAATLRVEADLKSLATVLKVYQAQSQMLPTTEQGLNALFEKPTIEPIPKRWTQLVRESLLDPWGQPYQYLHVPDRDGKSGKQFDIWSLGPDGKSDTEDDIGNWEPR